MLVVCVHRYESTGTWCKARLMYGFKGKAVGHNDLLIAAVYCLISE